MGRLEDLRELLSEELSLIYNPQNRTAATVHLYGVSLAAVILAKRRGLDPELAAMAGMLHDIAAYRGGPYETHALRSSNIAREILQEQNRTTPEETEAICSAIAHHDRKEYQDGPFEELLKDADVLHHTLHDPTAPVKDRERVRYEALCQELGMESYKTKA